MARRNWKRLVGCGALAMLSPLLIGGAGPTSNWQSRALASHNRERSALGIPALKWDDGLAADAQLWADQLARTGGFHHAPENEADPEGENLWAGTKAYFPIESMVDAWIAEKRFFRPGRFPENSSTGRVEDVGHYTQLVWRSSTDVGCALARGTREDLLVCRYKQAGNWRGDIPY